MATKKSPVDELLKKCFKNSLKEIKKKPDRKSGGEGLQVYIDGGIPRFQALEDFEKFLKREGEKFTRLKDKRDQNGKVHGVETLHLPDFKVFILFKSVKTKGQGGRDFEKELKADLINYYNGLDKFQHPDVIKELEDIVGIKPSHKTKVEHPGPSNQKRKMEFNGNKFIVTHSTGTTLADLTLLRERNDPLYLSLKMSQTYFIINGGVGQYFKDKTTRKSAYEYFGLDGGVNGMGLYGRDWVAGTDKPNYTQVKRNLERLVADAHGTNVTIVYKRKQNDVFVSQTTDKKATVVLTNLNESCYQYLILKPVPGQRLRRYTNIEVDAKINNVPVTLHFQFRDGTEAGIGGGPIYLRLMVKKH